MAQKQPQQPLKQYATVVTAFYPIRSKFPLEQYLEWSRRFMELRAPVVLFTEPDLAATFAAMRPADLEMHIITRPFTELDTWVLYKSEWERQIALDHEAAYHSPELYAIWAQKAFFVAEVVRSNPFGTDTFYWCDIGAFRESQSNIPQGVLETFPLAARLRAVAPAILMNSVAPLGLNEGLRCKDSGGIFGNFKHVNRIVGGLWGGTGAACLRWLSAYEAQLIRYFRTPDRFAGKDQSVMLSAYLEDPSLAFIAAPTTKCGDHWFFQQYLLSDCGFDVALQRDDSYTVVGPPLPALVTVKLMGGLGNQMFQIAAAYAHARRYRGAIVLPAEKEEPDGRPMYWSSVFHRFQHHVIDPSGPQPFIKPSHWERAATEYTPIPALCSVGHRLFGYFQSARYFAEYAGELRDLFRPSASVMQQVKAKYDNLLEMRDRIVVVHARRGDYLKAADHHGLLGVDYYCRAIDAIETTAGFVENPVYLLVSDDPLWWIQALPSIPHLASRPFHILMEEDEILSFTLLQQFHRFILSNSTFAWWFAWMADAANVVAPATWFGPKGPAKWEDIYLQHWLRV